MTENEAIEIIKKHCEGCEHNAGIECFAQGEEGICWEVKKRAIMSLRKVQEYKTIGTVEECRAAVEKQRAINPTFVLNFGDFESLFACECGKKIVVRHNRGVMDNHDGPKFCSNCGIRWDWSDTP